ncbi:g8826 [Coccomyxa elongata]
MWPEVREQRPADLQLQVPALLAAISHVHSQLEEPQVSNQEWLAVSPSTRPYPQGSRPGSLQSVGVQGRVAAPTAKKAG